MRNRFALSDRIKIMPINIQNSPNGKGNKNVEMIFFSKKNMLVGILEFSGESPIFVSRHMIGGECV